MLTTRGLPAVAALAGAVLILAACTGNDSSGAGAPGQSPNPTAAVPAVRPAVSVTITSPEDGATVSSPVTVEMEATGQPIRPAGSGEGVHLHLIRSVGCVAPGMRIPRDEQHLHLDDGATTTQLELAPGIHHLCLQAGDSSHTALGEIHAIAITVE